MGKFRNIFFGIVLFLTFFNLHAHSEVVNKVRIEGNERISSETIVIFGDILIGKDYDKSDISLLIKKLYETTFFSNISVEIKNNKLIIVVKENPIINSIFLKGEKATKYKDKIKELLILKEKSSYVSNNIKRDINLI